MDIKNEQSTFDELVTAFYLMWEKFPEPVTLVHKSKEVVAVNSACQLVGREQGMNCAKQGAPEAHRGCLAHKAIQAQQPAWRKLQYGEKEVISYWLPVPGYPDFFIHFGVGMTVDYDQMPVMDPVNTEQ